MMAKGTSLSFLYLSLIICSSGTMLGLSHRERQKFPLSHTEILDDIFPTTPTSTTPDMTYPYNPPPDIDNTNPVMPTPTNPATMPITVPSTTIVPPTNPALTNPTITPPITVPAGAEPVTNPVPAWTPYPFTTPVTMAPPGATTSSPAVQGQSWCVAKTGAMEAALQAALDYACGVGGADCSQIQQGGTCYNPNSLQNHASYAFNSYYQKNPSQTSCDFGGTATLVNINPSSGSCIYLLSSSSSSTSTPSSSANPTPTPIPIPTTPSSPSPPSGMGEPSSATPPSVLNPSNPASGTNPFMGPGVGPQVDNSTTSDSARLHLTHGCIVLLTIIITGKFNPLIE